MHFFIYGSLLVCMSCADALRLNRQSEPWASGCSFIYVDIGSNVGVQIRKLFEPSKYINASILPKFDQHFGLPETRTKASSETRICAIGFEANPSRVRRLKDIEKVYNAKGWRVKFMAPVVVSDVDNTNVSFYLDSNEGVNQWGSSIVAWQGEDNGYLEKPMLSVNVQTLDLARFLEKEIFAVNPEKVLMKMDIEGSEFIVLPELIRRGHLCLERVNEVFIEWHEGFQPLGTSSYEQLQHERTNQKCQSGTTPVSDGDDESYLLDGQPLPPTEATEELHKASSYFQSSGKDVARDIYAAAQKEWVTRRR